MTADNHRALVLLSALAFLWNLAGRIEPAHPAADNTPEARWVIGLLGGGKPALTDSTRKGSATRQPRDVDPRPAPAARRDADLPGERVVSLGAPTRHPVQTVSPRR
jgi:hypothetical protein